MAGETSTYSQAPGQEAFLEGRDSLGIISP